MKNTHSIVKGSREGRIERDLNMVLDVLNTIKGSHVHDFQGLTLSPPFNLFSIKFLLLHYK